MGAGLLSLSPTESTYMPEACFRFACRATTGLSFASSMMTSSASIRRDGGYLLRVFVPTTISS